MRCVELVAARYPLVRATCRFRILLPRYRSQYWCKPKVGRVRYRFSSSQEPTASGTSVGRRWDVELAMKEGLSGEVWPRQGFLSQ